jgi:hypothetical protein
MGLPAPKAEPDPILARVILDVEAMAGEFPGPVAYFLSRGHDYDPLAAAMVQTATEFAHAAYHGMNNNRHKLAPIDYLAAHTIATTSRGLAYGLELARRTT